MEEESKMVSALKDKMIDKLVNCALESTIEFDLKLSQIYDELSNFTQHDKLPLLKRTCFIYSICFYSYINKILNINVFEDLTEVQDSSPKIGICLFDCSNHAKIKVGKVFLLFPEGNEPETFVKVAEYAKNAALSAKGGESNFKIQNGGLSPWMDSTKDILKFVSEMEKKLEITFKVGLKFNPEEYFEESSGLYSIEGGKKPVNSKELVDSIIKLKSDCASLEFVEDLIHSGDDKGWKIQHILLKDKGIMPIGTKLTRNKTEIIETLLQPIEVEEKEEEPVETKSSKKKKEKKNAEEVRIETEIGEMTAFPLENWGFEGENCVTFSNILDCVKLLGDKRIVLHDTVDEHDSTVVLDIAKALQASLVVLPFQEDSQSLAGKFERMLN